MVDVEVDYFRRKDKIIVSVMKKLGSFLWRWTWKWECGCEKILWNGFYMVCLRDVIYYDKIDICALLSFNYFFDCVVF